MMTNLAKEVARFKKWAKNNVHTSAEWECDYEHWNDLWEAAKKLIQRCTDELPDIETSQDLLYVIARDNETEILREELFQYPKLLRHLARLGIDSTDPDAKWQLVVTIAEAQLYDAADLIRPYLNDREEYVRRRSLLAIAPFASLEAEKIAKDWMEKDYEYSRIAGLHVLHTVNSDSLSFYLARHTNDPNQYVRYNVDELKTKSLDN